MIRSKLKLYSTPRVCGALFHYHPSSSSSSSTNSGESLFLRISRAGDPTIPMGPLLDKWVEEGRDIKPSQLTYIIRQLKFFRRFAHALQISEWISNKRNLNLCPQDIAIRLELISKVHSIDQAERYFYSFSDTSRDFTVYFALLRCYTEHKYVEKAEAIMQKIVQYTVKHEDLVSSYNILLKLYAQIGDYKKMDALMQEIKQKNLYDKFTLTTLLNAYGATTEIDRMDKLITQMETDPRASADWLAYHLAANGYLKAGQSEKSLAMLKKSEQLIETKMRRNAYECLITTYAALEEKKEVYRIWEMCKKLKRFRNSSYTCMLTALVKLDDINGAERILEEWESGHTHFDKKIPNVMMSGYCKKVLLEKAEAYVERLIKSGKKLDGSMWDHLACGYCKCNDMDNAVQTMKKAILAGRSGWKPSFNTLAACIDHMKDKGDLELALEILRMCMQRGHFSAATNDRLLSYVHGQVLETKALNLLGNDHMKADEDLDEEKHHEM